MDECRECEGAIIDCIDQEGTLYRCPRCGNETDQWGRKIQSQIVISPKEIF